MNKARRHELKMLKYKKRLTNLSLISVEGKFFAFRSHGKPCSCIFCKNPKYQRPPMKVIMKDTDDEQKNEDYDGWVSLKRYGC